MKELGYNTISRVMETWESARRAAKGNFEDELGTHMLIKLFELEPDAKNIFGFSKNEEPELGNPTTSIHSRTVVSMFDSVLQMLGPDVELIQEILAQVGKRHKDFGVQTAYFPHMGEALLYALEQVLGPDEFLKVHKAAWVEIYSVMSQEIVKSMD
mmetsp:Transcript_5161/g.10182  ORF Transcript_5161/g.10182 Transcript_5161/m.10182 type:complete len:156 (-) Transcript_5161:245-712(-)